MVVHLELDLDQVPEFDPCASVRTSSWPTRWLDKIQFKLRERMRMENDEQLQFLLKHLLQEALEVNTCTKMLLLKLLIFYICILGMQGFKSDLFEYCERRHGTTSIEICQMAEFSSPNGILHQCKILDAQSSYFGPTK